jgi:hypothetical protein
MDKWVDGTTMDIHILLLSRTNVWLKHHGNTAHYATNTVQDWEEVFIHFVYTFQLQAVLVTLYIIHKEVQVQLALNQCMY